MLPFTKVLGADRRQPAVLGAEAGVRPTARVGNDIILVRPREPPAERGSNTSPTRRSCRVSPRGFRDELRQGAGRSGSEPDDMVGVLPATLVAAREVQLPGSSELLACEHHRPEANRGTLGAAVLDALPAVEAQVQREGNAIFDRERLAGRQALDAHLIAPVPETRTCCAACLAHHPRTRAADRPMAEVLLEAIQPLDRPSPLA